MHKSFKIDGTLEEIESTDDERKLLALAYRCEGVMKMNGMTPDYYAQCMMSLQAKLGFSITAANLNKAAVKYL